ncbi:N-acetylmuramate alpha-1-phosphate uridylyltransferase MurU [Rheinheimera sp.]|uniref:N-acetylmuramate alpha-1-phosphate uridylyltransferase MurU n=1 Tax=Rheinheimera sp. TaxID=1869214 RepID=UPI00307EF349
MKAMILAAGRGERMRPLTDQLPKPLLAAAGKPLIQYHIEALVRAGYSELVINHAWLGDKLTAYLGNGSQFAARIQYSDEGAEGLETAGGIRQALPLLGPDPFLVVNGDIWTDLDFKRLLLPESKLAHLVLVPNPPQHPAGDFGLSAEGVALAEATQQYTFSGIALYRPEFFAAVPHGKQKLAPFLRDAMRQGQVSAQLYQGLWFDIGTVERLNQLSALLERSDVG